MAKEKLSESNIELLFDLRNSGLSQSKIAAQIGTTQATISSYLTGKSSRGPRRYHRPSKYVLTGRYRDLEIIEQVKGGYLCLCHACGGKKVLPGWRIAGKRGYRSCGCLQAPPALIGTAFRILKTVYTASAKKRGISFQLTDDEFSELTKSRCFYCGIEPRNKVKAKSGEEYLYNGIDRRDPKLGYTKENCVPCCGLDNYMKGNMTLDEFFRRCRIVYLHSGYASA